MFEPEVFRKQIYCIKEGTCDIVVTCRRPPRSDSAPEELCPPRYTPGLQLMILKQDRRLRAPACGILAPDVIKYIVMIRCHTLRITQKLVGATDRSRMHLLVFERTSPGTFEPRA